MSSLSIRSATLADAWSLVEIYNHYVRHTVVTLHDAPLPTRLMAQGISAVRSSSLPWLVAESRDGVVGSAYAGRFKDRGAYRYRPETSVYLAHGRVRHGIGTRLY